MLRDQFIEKGGLPSTNREKAGEETHTVTGTVSNMMGFFPRHPTTVEWERMRRVHPDLVPKQLSEK